MKYSSLIVDIKDGNIKASSPMIDIATIDDLAKLAERHNAMILHEAGVHTHSYYVQGDGVTYRFVIEETVPGKPVV